MDNGNALYDRICAQDYEESQDDVLTVSGMVEDIRDALLDYQVGDDEAHAATVSLKLGRLADVPTTGDVRPELQADRE